MKSYFKIIILLLSAVCVTLFVSPIIADITDFHLYKIMSRVVLISVLVLFLNYKYRFGFQSIKDLGLEFNAKWWKLVLLGFVLGIISIGIILLIMLSNSIRFIVSDISYLGWIRNIIQYLFAGFLIAFFEELIFRGFIFQSLLKDSGMVGPVFFTNILYSIVHFMKPSSLDYISVLSLFSSIDALPKFFSPVILNFTNIWPSLVGLFLVGAVLSAAYLRTKSLALPIGLHAGWVMAIKSISITTDSTTSGIFWMSGNVVENPITWFVLIILFFLIRWSGVSFLRK
jgi:membrane protease YdiL (CAAX protease family)